MQPRAHRERRVRTVYIVMEPININQCDSQTEPRRQGPNWLHPIDTEKAKDQTTSKRESLSRRPRAAMGVAAVVAAAAVVRPQW